MRISDWSSDVCSSDLFGASEAPVGSDTIDGGEGNDAIAGEALAVAEDGYAEAYALNVADGGEAAAGNDQLYGGHGSDTIAGEALAIRGHNPYARSQKDTKTEGHGGGKEGVST